MITDAPRLGPLSNITVLDLTQFLADPFATQVLGDLGAKVIKVEPPNGDPTREIGPHFLDGDSTYFQCVNRNKKSVRLDLKEKGGRSEFLAMVPDVDAIVENYRPGTMEKLGVVFEVLCGLNDKVVLCSISGFGQSGSGRELPAFDMIVQALSGGMSLTGDQVDPPFVQGCRSGISAPALTVLLGLSQHSSTSALGLRHNTLTWPCSTRRSPS